MGVMKKKLHFKLIAFLGVLALSLLIIAAQKGSEPIYGVIDSVRIPQLPAWTGLSQSYSIYDDINKGLPCPSDSSNKDSSSSPPYDVVIGLSHHKTGTFQLRCLLKYFSAAAKLVEPVAPTCFRDNSVKAKDVANCFKTQFDNVTHPIRRPVLFKSYHGLTQTCEDENSSYEPCLSFMIYKTCRQRGVAQMLAPANSCTTDVSKLCLKKGYFNMIRNPIDAVLSAFTYHTGRPVVEKWMFKNQSLAKMADQIKWAGAGPILRGRMGLGIENFNKEMPYVDLLTSLPVEYGVLLEFWHSLPEIISITRQYQVLSREPGAFHARFEDMRDSFNTTVLSALRHLKLGSTPEALLEAAVAGGCDPNTWSEEQRAKSDHVTVGKAEDFKQKAEASLMGYEPAKRILCDLATRMDYVDRRCS